MNYKPFWNLVTRFRLKKIERSVFVYQWELEQIAQTPIELLDFDFTVTPVAAMEAAQ